MSRNHVLYRLVGLHTILNCSESFKRFVTLVIRWRLVAGLLNYYAQFLVLFLCVTYWTDICLCVKQKKFFKIDRVRNRHTSSVKYRGKVNDVQLENGVVTQGHKEANKSSCSC